VGKKAFVMASTIIVQK